MHLIIVCTNRFVKNNMIGMVASYNPEEYYWYYYYIARETLTNVHNMRKVVINRLSYQRVDYLLHNLLN